jgi:hypothetical protein
MRRLLCLLRRMSSFALPSSRWAKVG